jgi:hypothetical protein
MTSFRRFTMVDVPRDVASYGYTTEEYKSQVGEPHPSLTKAELNPMPATDRVRSSALYAGRVDKLQTSDKLRLDNPDQPSRNPAAMFVYELRNSRNSESKLKGDVLRRLNEVVADTIQDPNLQKLYFDSLRRVEIFSNKLALFNAMATRVESTRVGSAPRG